MKIEISELKAFAFGVFAIVIVSGTAYSEEQASTDGIRKAVTGSLVRLLCDNDFVECVGLDASHCVAAIENSFKSCWDNEELAECVTKNIQNNTGIDLNAYYKKCKSIRNTESE